MTAARPTPNATAWPLETASLSTHAGRDGVARRERSLRRGIAAGQRPRRALAAWVRVTPTRPATPPSDPLYMGRRGVGRGAQISDRRASATAARRHLDRASRELLAARINLAASVAVIARTTTTWRTS